MLPLLFALPPLFFPVHVILLELAIDPVCSLVFEAEPSTPEIMRQPPRKNASLFGRRELLLSLAQGLVILITAFSIYFSLLQFGYEITEARASTFIATILGNLTLAFRQFCRSRDVIFRHPALRILEHSCRSDRCRYDSADSRRSGRSLPDHRAATSGTRAYDLGQSCRRRLVRLCEDPCKFIALHVAEIRSDALRWKSYISDLIQMLLVG